MLKQRSDCNSHGASLAELSLTEANNAYGFETGVQPATITIKISEVLLGKPERPTSSTLCYNIL